MYSWHTPKLVVQGHSDIPGFDLVCREQLHKFCLIKFKVLVALVLLGLTAGWLADEIVVLNLEILKLYTG